MIKRLLLICFGLCYSLSVVYCQSEQLVINVSPSSLPGILIFENPKGSIKITGYDGDVILVTGSLRFNATGGSEKSGLHKIEQNPVDVSAEVNGNSYLLQCKTTGKTVDFDIKVPTNFSLKLKSIDNGIIDVLNINGEIEAENTSGDISLSNISGSAVLSSVYGKISASFRDVKPNTPIMLTSFEGDITLCLPASVNAVLKMKTDKGEILSDFNIIPLKREPVVKNIENKKIYSLEDWIVGSINAGGPEYIVKSYTGNLFVRKKIDIL